MLNRLVNRSFFVALFLGMALLLTAILAQKSQAGAMPSGEPNAIFLPMVQHDVCVPIYSAVFESAESTNWPVSENNLYKAGVTDGNYQIFIKEGGFIYPFLAPTCGRSEYTVEVFAHWDDALGSSYGIVFDVSDDGRSFYLFDMNAEFQLYRLIHVTPGGVEVIEGPNPASDIDEGNNDNYLKIRRYGDLVNIEINGRWQRTWTIEPVSGPTFVGVAAGGYANGGTADARFDNFKIETLNPDGTPLTRAAIMPQNAIQPQFQIEAIAPLADQ